MFLPKGWEIPYAGQNGMNPFKKSEIPDPVDTGKCAICNTVCSLDEVDNFFGICLLMIARKKSCQSHRKF